MWKRLAIRQHAAIRWARWQSTAPVHTTASSKQWSRLYAWLDYCNSLSLTSAVGAIEVQFVSGVTCTDEATDSVATSAVCTQRREQSTFIQVCSHQHTIGYVTLCYVINIGLHTAWLLLVWHCHIFSIHNSVLKVFKTLWHLNHACF